MQFFCCCEKGKGPGGGGLGEWEKRVEVMVW